MGNARAPYSVAKANRDEKVRRWKAIGKFKKQQKREEREAADDEYEGHYLAEEQSLRDVDM